ncbi:hypothetical protein T5B8_19298 [Salinisphaera sp. T5B8]|uniref:hypothetical protein n=1 Tax=Salinisphaera sp. T5B8 TaxID=1304154 RepID=UPI003340853F
MAETLLERDSTLDAATLAAILTWARTSHIEQRAPDESIPDPNNPYLLRWFARRKFRQLDPSCEPWLTRLWQFEDRALENAYVHRFMRSDDDRALHDHPWSWVTVLLDGSYWEHVPADPDCPAGPTVRRRRNPGDIVVRRDAAYPHRVELEEGRPVTTLFLTGEKSREWGFYCDRGWRHWRVFTATSANGLARGCE